MDWRHIIDVSPWDKSGGSFWGMHRSSAKWFALAIIFISLMLISPPFDPLPNDWINFMLAGWIFKYLPSLGFNLILLSTYVVIGPALFFFGIFAYPYNTHSLLNGYINKAQSYLKRAFSKPINVAIGLILFYIMYNIYKGWLF